MTDSVEPDGVKVRSCGAYEGLRNVHSLYWDQEFLLKKIGREMGAFRSVCPVSTATLVVRE
jgi:hypothetical protein